MAITSYCKKCRQDVPRGDSCPYCGAKLTKSSARVVWCLEHSPVKDWMCWNAVLRIMAPAMVVLLGMILLLEGLAGGWSAVEALVNRGLLWTCLLYTSAAQGGEQLQRQEATPLCADVLHGNHGISGRTAVPG